MNKKISIIIPTFNKADLLIEMVNSIICQSYRNWELIIVDDGSTDNTQDRIQPLLDDSRIKYKKRPDDVKKGAQGCRNYGFSFAVGEYVCFFDSDDLISKNCLEERYSFINRVGCDYAIFPAATFQTDVSSYKLSKMGVSTGEDILTSFLSHYAQFTVWTAIYRRESIINIKWDEKIQLYQDLDYSMSCIFEGLSYEFSEQNNPNYFYRFEYSDNCISSNHCTPEKFDSTIYLFNKLLSKINNVYYHRQKAKSYKRDLLQFVMFYFSRVVNSGTLEQEMILLQFVRENYGLYPFMAFNVLKPFCKLSNNKRIVRLVTMIFYYCLYRPSHLNRMFAILTSRL